MSSRTRPDDRIRPVIELSDADILSRLANTEDATVERKTANDYRDCLKTAVGFSNSLPLNDPGIIFVGVGDDGTVQDRLNLDTLQKEVSKTIDRVYPPIYPQMKVMKGTDGKEFLAVVVRGSPNKPHFAGPSYIRDGSQTREASELQFAKLIAERSSKSHEILKYLGQGVTFRLPEKEMLLIANRVYRDYADGRVTGCNQFFVSVEFFAVETATGQTVTRSYPLAFIEISYDHAKKRPLLIALSH
jgi:Schlafen, AlbA_2